MGTKVQRLTERQVVEHVIASLQSGRGGWIATHNLDHIRRLRKNRDFANACVTASLRVADGMPLVWASRVAGTPLPQRVAGSSLIYTLTEAAARAGCSVYFLGGNSGTAERAAQKLQFENPQLRVAGYDCPAPGFELDPATLASVKCRIISARPDIIYVALGSPKQELLIADWVKEFPDAWFVGVGISFSFVCGEIKRAPKWMQYIGLEWIHRLAQEPCRLARRYLYDGLPFAALLFASAAGQRLMRLVFEHDRTKTEPDQSFLLQ